MPIRISSGAMRVPVAAVLAYLSSVVLAAGIRCGSGSNCPSSTPCCSQYGQCGVGAYCLGGCDPVHSFDLSSCVPGPVCKDATYKMNTLDDIQDISAYLGDASRANWVASGKPVVYNGDSILLTMAQGTVGTLLASTRYVWYGKVSATVTSSQGAGVVTAFILMSDAKDEIDFEFMGVDTQHVQSNYYFQGFPNYDHSANLSASNTESEQHRYTIDWTPDQLTWLVDGVVMRTLRKADTWNASANAWAYPQTPARVQLSLWPAGLASNGEGTVNWAGGLVDWKSPYMQNGYYYAMFKDIIVQCYEPPTGTNIHSHGSYKYTSTNATNTSVEMVSDLVMLGSLFASGDNPTYNPSGSAVPSSTAETVPGLTGGGPKFAGTDDETDGSNGDGSGGESPGGSRPVKDGGFNQGGSSSTASESGGSLQLKPEMVGGSILAMLVTCGIALHW